MTGEVSSAKCSEWVDGSGECEGRTQCCANRVPRARYRPYSIGCFRGCLAGNTTCTKGKSSGVTLSYVPTVSAYPLSVFEGEGWSTKTYPKLDVGKCSDERDPVGTDTDVDSKHDIEPQQYILIGVLAGISFVLFLSVGFLLQMLINSSAAANLFSWLPTVTVPPTLTVPWRAMAGGGIAMVWRSESEHGCLSFVEDNSDSNLNASARSDGTYDSAMAIDDVVVGFEDNSSSVFASCVRASDHPNNTKSSNMFPCIERPPKYGEDVDDTPWAI